jgi:hypothetical protein
MARFETLQVRRLEKVNTEALLKAAGQNVKRLMAFGSRGPRRVAQVAALRRPEARCPRRRFHEVRRHRRRALLGRVGPFSTRCTLLGTGVNRARIREPGRLNAPALVLSYLVA